MFTEKDFGFVKVLAEVLQEKVTFKDLTTAEVVKIYSIFQWIETLEKKFQQSNDLGQELELAQAVAKSSSERLMEVQEQAEQDKPKKRGRKKKE